MLIISYDIENDKLRTKFSKFIMQYGERLQYSVYKIENSERFLKLITAELDAKYYKKFSEDDSVMIMKVPNDSIIRYGRAKHEEEDLIIVD
ncbi:MAG: CRISPR-associated endonuclease Cas2 [Solobacterium sp.]|nr:CRISPR-associated endonuclease Cas2 [Solobacterium sp.]